MIIKQIAPWRKTKRICITHRWNEACGPKRRQYISI